MLTLMTLLKHQSVRFSAQFSLSLSILAQFSKKWMTEKKNELFQKVVKKRRQLDKMMAQMTQQVEQFVDIVVAIRKRSAWN